MAHIIIGIVAIAIGMWGIASNWYMFRDMLVAMVPLAVFCFGAVALLAGIRGMKARWGRQGDGRGDDDKDAGE